MTRLRRTVLAVAAMAAVGIPLGAVTASASPAHQQAKRVASSMFLTNDPDISAHSNGVGAQYTTTLEGNATDVERVNEGTACGGVTVYSFHNASGTEWMRVPAGATTLNLSTIRDARAEFLGRAGSHSGTIYTFFGNGCGSNAVIEVKDQITQGIFVRALPNGAFDDWTIR